MSVDRPVIPVIGGPTASGKTRAALDLAARHPEIEIVSADSRQIYRGLDIGTAKPTRDELGTVRHHMIDVVGPEVLYSAGMFAEAAGAAISEILSRGKAPLIVGGSGFYVKALFEGLGAPSVDPMVLARLERRLADEGAEALHAELAAIDSAAAAAHSPNNVVKTLRALACYYQTGRSYSTYLSGSSTEAAWTPSYLAIAPDRAVLYRRINDRVLAMVDAGLVEETERVLASGTTPDAPGLRTVGYAEAAAFLRGEIDRNAMIAATQQSTRRYAKRQMTWLRKVEGMTWVSAPEIGSIEVWYRSAVGG